MKLEVKIYFFFSHKPNMENRNYLHNCTSDVKFKWIKSVQKLGQKQLKHFSHIFNMIFFKGLSCYNRTVYLKVHVTMKILFEKENLKAPNRPLGFVGVCKCFSHLKFFMHTSILYLYYLN